MTLVSSQADFKSDQKRYSRVQAAYTEKETIVKQYLSKQGLEMNDFQLFIRAFKKEEKLEIWASMRDREAYKLIHTYSFCQSSGKLGPKRAEGDLQIPEGIYAIDRFNPASNFHLSLGINYPNSADQKLGQANPGGDIFIHGACATIGCIPITDDKIKELYILCVEAKNNGQDRIITHFMPYDLRENRHQQMIDEYPQHKKLWEELKIIQLAFDQTKIVPFTKINPNGSYSI